MKIMNIYITILVFLGISFSSFNFSMKNISTNKVIKIVQPIIQMHPNVSYVYNIDQDAHGIVRWNDHERDDKKYTFTFEVPGKSISPKTLSLINIQPYRVTFYKSISTFCIEYDYKALRSMHRCNEHYDLTRYSIINTNVVQVCDSNKVIFTCPITQGIVESAYLNTNGEILYVTFAADRKKYVFNIHNPQEYVGLDFDANTVYIYNQNGKYLYKRCFGEKDIQVAYVSADGLTLFCFFKDGSLYTIFPQERFTHYLEKKGIKTDLEKPLGYIFSDNRQKLAVNHDDRIDIYAYDKGVIGVLCIQKEGTLKGLCFSPDGKFFCLSRHVHNNKTLHVVDVIKKEDILQVSNTRLAWFENPRRIFVRTWCGKNKWFDLYK